MPDKYEDTNSKDSAFLNTIYLFKFRAGDTKTSDFR